MSEKPLTPEEESLIGTEFPDRLVCIDAKIHHRFQKQADIIGITVDEYLHRLLMLTRKTIPKLEKLILMAAEFDAVGDANTDFLRDLYNEEIEENHGN